ncbi:zinc finger protein Xfin [Betta splendens]|uniref:Zinc finger protein Xfin n=1 Tax=Betta splendens TaxID=158456 RepID=A0A6P7KVR7_BETSP|nr:zinc finger protein Xfin [Betta splendens]XP_055359392.1 zinc finger protein Xfin [Betta splendens]
MMLGLQGNASSSKVYRCVACSATFTGLASLLVHQASHASALAKVPALPPQSNIRPHETLSASLDLSSEHRSPQTVLPESPSPSFYICDCGEEFQDFNLMLEHKRSHVSQIQLLQSMGDNMVSSRTGIEKMFPTQHLPLTPAVNQPPLVLSCPSTSKSLAVELPTLTDHKADVSLGDGTAILTTPQDLCKPSQDDGENHDNMSATAEQITQREEEINSQDISESILNNEKGESFPKNNSIMKLLASAYMKRFVPRPTQINPNQNNSTVTPKQEVCPVDITPGAKPQMPAVKDLSITQLRRLLVKPGIKTKAPPIGRILESSKKKIVSLTKTFSPVVVLETRQKLMDPIGNGTYGSYQCGRCRRVFQSLDRLTEHHLLHKKERIKCCRRCKQLIIGRLPLPDNHVCPQLANRAKQSSSSLRSNLPFSQKVMPFHSYGNTKKIFFCPLCKHSYARRWNLKTHKCQGPRSAFPLQDSRPVQKMFALKSNSNGQTNAKYRDESQSAKNIAVNTELTSLIKVEATSLTSEQSAVSQLSWTNSAKNFLPFYPKSSSVAQDKDASPSRISHQQGDENSWNAAAENHDSSEGKWVMPLDDQMDMQSSAENADDDVDINDGGGEVAKSVDHEETTPPGLHYYVRDGVKRYPCNRCQKTYSRPCTLRRHLRLCGFRPRGLSALTQGQDASPLNANNVKPMFACFVCGKQFNRKDNMMTHRKRCQLQRTMSDVDGGMVQQSLPGSAADCPTQEDEGSNWGIMSLPSVLPRRVTCECGVGFTSPRLLLEHLQKHAQESYTCPTCGETVSSWADYEVHLQIHMHPNHLLLKGMQPQRSQPLLLRFQQQPSPPQPPTDVHQLPQKQPHPEKIISPIKKQQRIVCTRCGNSFATRCSLRKHISWNRCKGGRVVTPPTNLPKTYHCSHCNSDFPNTISLLFHQRSGACKPTIKPARCPVCLRWFGTMVGLQKHLLSHKQSESYRCDACQGTYSNLKSLQNHRRRIHRILVGGSKPVTQEPLTS